MSASSSSAKPNRQIISEASAWFVEFRAGDADAAARDQFSRWLRRSPDHIQAYLEVAGAWAHLPESDPQGKIDVRALIARARAEANIVELEGRTVAVGPPRRRFSSRSLAASVTLLLLTAAVAAWLGVQRRGIYETDIGEQRSITLTDGSSLELNARSRVRVRFDEQERRIDLLEGQALFRVAKDPDRPFTVRSDATSVRAIGTEFDVYRKRSGTVVTVLEGRVAVLSSPPALAGEGGVGASSTLLSAGEQVTLRPHEPAKPKRTDPAAATAWLQKRLIFEETPLIEVAEEFNRYNTRSLVIADPALQGVGISGVYSSTDPASLIRFLRDQRTIRVVETNEEIRITRQVAP